MPITELADIPLEQYGDTMKIEGIIVGDGHKRRLLYLPGEYYTVTPDLREGYAMTVEEADAWLHQSDNPTTQARVECPDCAGMSPHGPSLCERCHSKGYLTAIIRKAGRSVDQNIAWAVYARAGYKCEYCGATGVPLTYDHILARKYGGEVTMDNGAAACRPCNKTKGHMTLKEWVARMLDDPTRYRYAGDWAIYYAKNTKIPV